MFTRKSLSKSKMSELSAQVAKQFNRLFEDSTDTTSKLRALTNIQKLLECFAIGTYQFDLAIARVTNAKRYLESGETGAAKYEVRMLFGGLKNFVFEDESHDSHNSSVAPAPNDPPARPILAAIKSLSDFRSAT